MNYGISCQTLVNYSGSLTGRDFRTIAQAAPFVLEGFVSKDHLETWNALSMLVTLVWQPEISDIKEYTKDLKAAIDYFLDCTCRLTPRWFNKPKFHVLLHLPEHIQRFGPAMLFATEGFESYNAIIRSCSVHSNRHAPSKDIAYRMARGNRIRHILQGGYFRHELAKSSNESSAGKVHGQLSERDWVCASDHVQALLRVHWFGERLLGLANSNSSVDVEPSLSSNPIGLCEGKFSPPIPWAQTLTAKKTASETLHEATRVRQPEVMLLQNGDRCQRSNWVIWQGRLHEAMPITTSLGKVAEIAQVVGMQASLGVASLVLIQRALRGEIHEVYQMPQPQLLDEYYVVRPEDLQCIVNVQHDCHRFKCKAVQTRTVRLECEESREKALEVAHVSVQNMVLNTAQMRNSAHIRAFHRNIPVENRGTIIENAVWTEIANHKKAAQNEVNSGQSPTQFAAPVSAAILQHSMRPSPLTGPVLYPPGYNRPNTPVVAGPSTAHPPQIGQSPYYAPMSHSYHPTYLYSLPHST